MLAMQNATVNNMNRHHHESMQGLRDIREAIVEAMMRFAQAAAPQAPPNAPAQQQYLPPLH